MGWVGLWRRAERGWEGAPGPEMLLAHLLDSVWGEADT